MKPMQNKNQATQTFLAEGLPALLLIVPVIINLTI